MNDIYSQTLKQYWGYDDFRGIQRDIIESIGAGRDTLGLMPTGGGKSITFQVPALTMEGVCIVITPLIALMKDQVAHLRSRNIRATYIHQGLTHDQILTTLENCVFGAYKFLYVSPERLSSDLFIQKLRHMTVSFICVDEAHCISQWGYEFRPSYLAIKDIRQIVPDAPILALTATATEEVIQDIQHQLAFRQENHFRMSFERENLAYIVIKDDRKFEQLCYLLTHNPGSTIIYTRTRRQCWELCELLKQNGFTCTYYHAGLNSREKDERQTLWQTDKVRIMVATNAFGMGIDKPDVRQVIHMELPDSIEAYYQEAGRAGRDGQPAKAYLIYIDRDISKLRKRVADNYPEKDFLRLIYEHICFFYQVAEGFGKGIRREFHIEEFCQNFHHNAVQVHSALGILTKCGYLEYTDAEQGASRLLFTLQRDQLYILNEQDRLTDLVIRIILRRYTGLFVDYSAIDEQLIAQEAHTTASEVYNILVTLNKRNIIHYIPRKNIPHISFTTNRIDKQRLVIPPHVYDLRKAEYAKRIEAIIGYVTDDQCRNRKLLAYFGEEAEHDCGQCDVCLRSQQSAPSTQEREQLRTHILQQIDHDGYLLPFRITVAHQSRELAACLLQEMVNEEELAYTENGELFITKRGRKKYGDIYHSASLVL